MIRCKGSSLPCCLFLSLFLDLNTNNYPSSFSLFAQWLSMWCWIHIYPLQSQHCQWHLGAGNTTGTHEVHTHIHTRTHRCHVHIQYKCRHILSSISMSDQREINPAWLSRRYMFNFSSFKVLLWEGACCLRADTHNQVWGHFYFVKHTFWNSKRDIPFHFGCVL